MRSKNAAAMLIHSPYRSHSIDKLPPRVLSWPLGMVYSMSSGTSYKIDVLGINEIFMFKKKCVITKDTFETYLKLQ